MLQTLIVRELKIQIKLQFELFDDDWWKRKSKLKTSQK